MNWQDSSIAPLSTEAMRDAPQRGSMKRATIIAGGVIVLILGGLFAFNTIRDNNTRASLQSRPRPVQSVATEVLKAQPAVQILPAVGSLASVHQVVVSSEVSGQITRINYDGGAKVRKGDILVEMNIQRERADLDSAKAALQLAEVALRRSTELQQRGNASQAVLDQAKSQYDVAKAGVLRAQAAIDYKIIRAPFDGLLGTRDVEVGQYISPGQKLAELTDLSQLYINFTLPEQQRPRLAVGQGVELVVDAHPDKKVVGKVSVINPQIDANARSVKLQAVTDNKDGLLSPGMYTHATVLLPPLPDVITVPETALVNSLYGDFVFVAAKETKDGKERVIAKRIPVTTGQRYEGRVVVLTGLKDGDRIVATGLTKVQDGGEITLSDTNELAKPAEFTNQ